MSRTIPLSLHHSDNSLFAWDRRRQITHARFIDQVHQLAERLHDKPFVINLVENRYLFILTFAAALLRGQTSLLPPSRAPADIARIAENYPDCYYLSDLEADPGEDFETGIPHCRVRIPTQQSTHTLVPEIDADQIAAITFTSGSTGLPQPHAKHWGDLVCSTEAAAQRFGLYDKAYRIIATVPPQHMYGLETSVLYPLLTGCAVYGDKPFYPADINQLFNDNEQPAFLVTTPVHLRACVAAQLEWRGIEFIVSATAPLSKSLARQAQETMHAPVLEIFGCTEAGSIASRRTLESDTWRMYHGFQVHRHDGRARVSAAHLRETITLSDNIEVLSDREFLHLGRSNDMVNIGGKRGSLSDLNLKLQELEMIEAGAFFLPESHSAEQEHSTTRLTAFVVAPDANEEEILSALSEKIDAVFLPRPLYKVKQLPYNETGKLTQRALQDLYKQLRMGGQY